MKKNTVSFHTLGCRLNIFESDGLSTALHKEGIETIEEFEKPEIIIINTCTVTNKADSKNRSVIRGAIKNNPGAKIWVTGCYAETDKDIIENIPGVTGVVGNSEKSKLPSLILNHLNGKIIEPKEFDRFSYSDVIPSSHTRAYLKIQDGCNRVCSYCKIPSARGKAVSRKEEDVLNQVSYLQDNGVGEIILTGVNLGWYKDSESKKSFNSLVKKILEKLDYSRLRISSIEPSDVGHELAELTLHPRFCNYLHVPMQSGNSRILKLMKRSYTAETFYKRIKVVKEKNPSLFIGTDIITGFPSESETEFLDSVKLVNDLEISKIHAFPFSTRKGTSAENLKDSIPKEIKKERVQILNSVSKEKYKSYGEKYFGKTLEAIYEENNTAVTDNYLKLKFDSNQENLKKGQFLKTKILSYKEPNEQLKEGFFLASFES